MPSLQMTDHGPGNDTNTNEDRELPCTEDEKNSTRCEEGTCKVKPTYDRFLNDSLRVIRKKYCK